MKNAVCFFVLALAGVSLRAEPYKSGVADAAVESEAAGGESSAKRLSSPTRHPYWRDGAPKWVEDPPEPSPEAQDTAATSSEAKNLYKWGVSKEAKKPDTPPPPPEKPEPRTPASVTQPTDNWPVTIEEEEEARGRHRDTATAAKRHIKKDRKKRTFASQELDAESRGVVFRVQVLATKEYLLDEEIVQYFKRYNMKEVIYVFEQERDNGGYPYKYLVGSFRASADAQKYVAYARKLGLKDAFVVCYYNNQRIPIQEGLLLQHNKR